MNKTHTRNDISAESVELTVTLPSEAFVKSYNTLLEKESKGVDMKGFRKGSVPSDIIESKLKDSLILETFERIAPIYVSQAVTAETLEIVAPPAYKEIPKIEKGKDIVFTVVCTIMPEFKLGNIKKVKADKKKVEVEQKEIDSVMKELEQRKTKAKFGTDEWVKEMSTTLSLDGVKNMDELKKEISERLLAQKEMNARKEDESSVLKQAVSLTKITIPQPAIDYEALERERSFQQTLEERKITLEQFLSGNQITIENMREMWKEDAKEALETDVFLKTYAKANKLEVSMEELEAEVTKIKKEHAGHDHDYYDDPQWREYVRRVILKQKAYDDFIKTVLPIKK